MCRWLRTIFAAPVPFGDYVEVRESLPTAAWPAARRASVLSPFSTPRAIAPVIGLAGASGQPRVTYLQPHE